MDVRALVRQALVARVADTTWWPPADATRFHNRLLDDCGDVARPDVALLMQLHARDVGGRLPQAVLSHAAWHRERAMLTMVFAHELSAEGGVHEHDLLWAVESWALALSVIDAALLIPPPPVRAPRRTATSGPQASAGRTSRAGTGPSGTGASPSVPTSSPSVPTSTKRGRGWPHGPIARAAPTPNHWTYRWPLDAITFGMMAFLGVGVAVAEWAMARDARLARERTQRAAVTAASSDVRSANQATTLVASAAGSVMATATPEPEDAVRAPQLRVLPNTGPVVAVAGDRAPSAVDTVQLRDGRLLVGTIGVITESHLYLTDAATGLPFELRVGAVTRVRTHAGRQLRFDAAGDDSARSPSLIVRGVGGRYVVRRRVLAASGDASCEGTGRAIDPVEQTDEEITHAPGSATFTMPSRPGVHGTIAPDGRFETVLLSGIRAMGDYSWRMVGHFTPTGFIAEADASTVVVTRWRDSQRCRFLTELTGVRRP